MLDQQLVIHSGVQQRVKMLIQLLLKPVESLDMQKNNGKWHSIDYPEKVKQGNIRNGHDPNWRNGEKLKLAITEDDCHSAMWQHCPSFPR